MLAAQSTTTLDPCCVDFGREAPKFCFEFGSGFWGGFFPPVFSKENSTKKSPANSPGSWFRKIPLGFLQEPCQTSCLDNDYKILLFISMSQGTAPRGFPESFNLREETKGQFRKRGVLANVRWFRFLAPGNMYLCSDFLVPGNIRMYLCSGFWGRATSAKTTLVAPYCAIPRDHLSDTPYCALWGSRCLNMANWVRYPLPLF